MSVNAIAEYEVKCRYAETGIGCFRGHLYQLGPANPEDPNRPPHGEAIMVLVEGEYVKCPCCNGTGLILTPAGTQLVEVLWRHIEPKVVDLIHQFGPGDKNA
jgi:hypothetical protein